MTKPFTKSTSPLIQFIHIIYHPNNYFNNCYRIFVGSLKYLDYINNTHMKKIYKQARQRKEEKDRTWTINFINYSQSN